ncbi:hypothetical protein [Conexibacter woesei]|uniref:Peptidase S55 domain-containing protein n=1 Tax=Conexibacter woesei (strain DSM 14684 / CCUG 47730 / CIP 108061 / JCM 11494 / NBRC 100937 / ID131577) TaxID=469383 RepID=D3F061_CONWI|nr:hypothetical protein [Conexibacter woesei]ADB50037.1 hypothetical protein Cwoe_1609 [Conexibacter woesei DSM 14684]
MLARVLTATGLFAAVATVAAPSAAARDPIVPLSDVHRGMTCTARTVVQGTTITTFGVEVLDVVDDVSGTGPRILVRVSGDAVAGSGIASGFSGSPVYCADRTGAVGNAGAVSATIGQYGNDVGLVTPIEQLLGLRAKPPSGARKATRAEAASVRPIAAPLTFTGLSPALARLVERAGRAAGRRYVAAPTGPLATFGPQPLVPGASMAAAYSTGAIGASAIGTVTYRDGATVYGFGHQLDGAGRRSLVLQDAYVFTVVDNPLDTSESSSYKLAAPGHALGTLSNDAPAAVVGTVGESAPTIPFTVRVRDRDRGRTLRQRTEVADEVDVGDPTGQGLLPTIGPMALAQAVTAAFDGAPARESGVLCLRVTVREARSPLRFCNRYVANGQDTGGVPALALAMGSDVTSALTAVDQARFANLHVTSVYADVAFSRGLELATIVGVSGPRALRRGGTARVRLRVREFRGPLRTIPVTLSVPRDAPLGEQQLRIAGTPLDTVDSGGETTLVIDVGGGGDGTDGGGAQSMEEVRARFGGTARYDGLRARLGSARWRAARDDRLRIDGRGTLDVVVKRAGSGR